MTEQASESLFRLTRQVEKLKRERSKLRPDNDAAHRELTDALLTVSDSLLQELGGAEMTADGLRTRIRTEMDAWIHLFSAIPIPCVVTNRSGHVLQANTAAGSFFNVSPKHLVDRQLLLFTENRVAFSNILQCLPTNNDQFRITLTFRPKERRRTQAQVTIVPLSETQDDAWIWFLNPLHEGRESSLPGEVIHDQYEQRQRSSRPKA